MGKQLPTLADRAPSTECCPTTPSLRPRATASYLKLFKALADETRLEILGLLAAKGAELCACDIEAHFSLSQPTMSHHLKILREAGLINGDRRGTWVYYAIERNTLQLLAEFQKLAGG